jgi:molybdenum cofactor biosynthesis protein B
MRRPAPQTRVGDAAFDRNALTSRPPPVRARTVQPKLRVVSATNARPTRCLVATVVAGRASVQEDVTQVVVGALRAGGFLVERTVTVQREREFIQQLVSNIANGNEADAILLIGGVGVGPRDYTCEAVDDLADRRMEGFGEAYRRLLFDAEDNIASVVTVRAMAAVYSGCIVVALPRQNAAVMRRAMETLVVPMLPEAMRIAVGPIPPRPKR